MTGNQGRLTGFLIKQVALKEITYSKYFKLSVSTIIAIENIGVVMMSGYIPIDDK